MNFDKEEIRKIFAVGLLLLLVVIAFLLLKPILLAIIAGLILAYIFNPVYKRVNKIVKNKTLSVSIVCLLVILIIFVPLWFIIPIIIKQVFNMFTLAQNLDIHNFITTVLPSASPEFIAQISASVNSAISQASSAILNSLVTFLLDLPNLLLQFTVIAFVFFFALRDSENLKDFVIGLSPLKKEQEKAVIQQFENITYSIIYGAVIVGIIQGLVAGVGLFIFGIPNALILTLLSILFSIVPITGAFLVFAPPTIYLFSSGHPTAGILFLLYNILVVSWIDNVLRAEILAKKTDLSPAIAVIGMIGGILIFGLLGLILGPLILAYIVIILKAYKENTLANIF